MGNKDFIKAILERRGTVHFGRVRSNLNLLPNITQSARAPSSLSEIQTPATDSEGTLTVLHATAEVLSGDAGQDEAWQALDICNHRGLEQQQGHGGVWAARQPSQQHSHLQSRLPASPAEAVWPPGGWAAASLGP